MRRSCRRLRLFCRRTCRNLCNISHPEFSQKVVAKGHAGKALYIEVKDLADEVPQLSKIIRRSGAVIHSMEILYDSDSKLRKKKNTSTIKALIFPKSDESLNMIISTIRADENVVDIYVD